MYRKGSSPGLLTVTDFIHCKSLEYGRDNKFNCIGMQAARTYNVYNKYIQ